MPLSIHPSIHFTTHLHLVKYLLTGLGLSDLIINMIIIKGDDDDHDDHDDDEEKDN